MDYTAAFNRSDRVHVRRMQCTFYWDWVKPFYTAGLWRPVTLYCYDRCYLEDVFVYTHDLAKTSASLQLRLETGLRADSAEATAVSGISRPLKRLSFSKAVLTRWWKPSGQCSFL